MNKSSEISKMVADYNSVIKDDVQVILNNVAIDLDNLKSEVVGDYLDQKKSDDHDLGMIIVHTGRYTESKANLKSDAEQFMQRKYESWNKRLESLFKSLQGNIETMIDNSALVPSDFTGTDNVTVNTPSPKKRSVSNLYPSLEDEDDSEFLEEIIAKKKKRNSVPSGNARQPRNSRRRTMATSSFLSPSQFPSLIDESTEEEEAEKCEEEIIQRFPPKRRNLSTQKNTVNKQKIEKLNYAQEQVMKKMSQSSSSESSPPEVSQSTRKKVGKMTVANNVKNTNQATIGSPENGDNYRHLWNSAIWYPLNALPQDIPALPAVYHIKIKQAKKSVYIGFCNNLCASLLKYKNSENTGNKQLDKYIARNRSSVEIQCRVYGSQNVAQQKQREELQAFIGSFSRSPVYNVV